MFIENINHSDGQIKFVWVHDNSVQQTALDFQ